MSVAVRILVVDDAAHWCKFVEFILRIDPELEIVSYASSGHEAVIKAQELRPSVVLLDIGLPGISAIEAGRRILESTPDTKIVFLTQQTDLHLVYEALCTGAIAYVLKTDAAAQLVTAIHSAVNGRVFLSHQLPPTLRTIQ